MSTALAPRIAQLRRLGQGDTMAALLAEAPDVQVLCDQLGELLDTPVVRMQWLTQRLPRFDLVSFTDCARRRCMTPSWPAGWQALPMPGKPPPLATQAWPFHCWPAGHCGPAPGAQF